MHGTHTNRSTLLANHIPTTLSAFIKNWEEGLCRTPFDGSVCIFLFCSQLLLIFFSLSLHFHHIVWRDRSKQIFLIRSKFILTRTVCAFVWKHIAFCAQKESGKWFEKLFLLALFVLRDWRNAHTQPCKTNFQENLITHTAFVTIYLRSAKIRIQSKNFPFSMRLLLLNEQKQYSVWVLCVCFCLFIFLLKFAEKKMFATFICLSAVYVIILAAKKMSRDHF